MAKSNQFVVDLGDARIPDEVAHKIETAVRRAALAALADLDLRGDIGIKIPPELRGIYLNIERLKFG